jgi:hypothetical protein
MTEKPKSPGLDWIQLVQVTAPALSALLVKVASTAHAVERGEPAEAETEIAVEKPGKAAKTKQKATAKADAKRAEPEKAAPLPDIIMRRLMKVEAVTITLSNALALRVPAALLANPARTEADREVDAAIKALDGFLLSKTIIPEKKERAEKARKAFFKGEGHEWLNADFESQWADVKSRLHLIDTTGVAADIVAIGGEDVLDHLRAKFKLYGIALGITEVAKEASKVDIEGPYLAALDALRRYVAVIVGHGATSDDFPEAGILAEKLLAPIERARNKNSTKSARAAKEGEPVGEEGAEPKEPDEANGDEEAAGGEDDETGGTD